jgi:hypothetical protein
MIVPGSGHISLLGSASDTASILAACNFAYQEDLRNVPDMGTSDSANTAVLPRDMFDKRLLTLQEAQRNLGCSRPASEKYFSCIV